MDSPLTREARIELLRALRPRYQSSRSRTKKQILDEFVAAYDRLHTITPSNRRSRNLPSVLEDLSPPKVRARVGVRYDYPYTLEPIP